MFGFFKTAKKASAPVANIAPVSIPVNGRNMPMYAAVCTDCENKGMAKDIRDIKAADIRAGMAYPVAELEYGSHSSGFSFVGKRGWFNANLFNFYALDEENGLLPVSIFDFPQFSVETVMLQ